ncbi:hypothetical protein D0Z00_002055 [Geotrichum galactomycetum]|uniref:Uncharacterized protein n=1 Tax=Geotrichum galactomycetum TaxID=27317 RepID=A0ACB6V5A0_9ASCO|nr:hypothetical protein D0Z00_002055 [Geotrichum candidum]
MALANKSLVYKAAAPWIILVGGGHFAGKKLLEPNTTSSTPRLPLNIQIIDIQDYEDLSVKKSVLLSKVYREEDLQSTHYKPTRFDFEKLKADIKNYTTPTEENTVKYMGRDIVPPTVLFVQGLYALYDPELRDMASMRIFIDLDGDVRLGRWKMDHFIQRTQEHADIILPGGNEPSSIKLVTTGVYDKVHTDVVKEIRSAFPGQEVESTPVLRCLHKKELPAYLSLDKNLPEEQFYDVN